MRWITDGDGVLFLCGIDGEDTSDDLEHQVGGVLLKELCENGMASRKADGNVHLAFEQAANLSSYEKTVLDLPERYPFTLRVESAGDLQQSDFRFQWGFYSHYHGEKLPFTLKGNMLYQGDEAVYSLTLSQYKACNLMDSFNCEACEKSLPKTLTCLKELQELAKNGGVELESILAGTHVEIPEKLGLTLEADGNDILLAPEVPNVDQKRFIGQINRIPNLRDIYTESAPDGSRKRVVFNESQKEEMEKIKKNRRIPSEKTTEFIEHPEEWFDPDIIDLDSFSERVKTIGFYKPRYYAFITPYKSQWFEGIMFEDAEGEQHKIVIRNEDDLNALHESIECAEREGKSNVILNDVTIPVSEARDLFLRSQKTLKSSHEKTNDLKEPRSENKVLIIFENVEDLDFQKTVSRTTTLYHLFETPPHLDASFSLLPHQEEGVAWLQQLLREYGGGIVGALLADDMGLGKTLQILSFIEWHNEKHNAEGLPYLVVGPVALLENWAAEYRRFFPEGDLAVCPLHGAVAKEGIIKYRKGMALPKGLYLTTYETLRGRQKEFCSVDWSVVVLDEAQKIKTPGTLVTNASKALKADFRIAATGTPVENTLVDLWCLTDFVMPGLLGSAKDFNRRYNKPSGDGVTEIRSIGEEIQQRLGVFFKRRLKKDILSGLPKKFEKKLFLPMTHEQIKIYNDALSSLTEYRFEGKNKQGLVLSTLQRLRNISDHPYLGEKQQAVFETAPCKDLINASAKLVTTVEILHGVREKGEKVILFSPSRAMQSLLRRVLVEEFNMPAEHVSVINGETPASALAAKSSRLSRQGAIDAFQSRPGFQAIVMSPLAAGFGLNIAGANHVVHYTRHWNPAKENQATDRAYRIGQERDVFVYYPIATGQGFRSFDEILDERLQLKIDLASQTLFPTEKAEVTPADLLEELQKTEGKRETNYSRMISPHDVDEMDPFLFEALIACLWEHDGYKTILTPKENDRGADVVATG
ncbi:MAG: hypothetical protein EOM12_12265, partial [Verrucomicrobiae bacterium]|nr:hypothetical protein [Verrucomicrobiae bacterium]